MGRSGLNALGILLATLLLGVVASILLPIWQHPPLAVVPADDQDIDWSAGLGEHGAVYILREMSRGRALSDARGQLSTWTPRAIAWPSYPRSWTG